MLYLKRNHIVLYVLVALMLALAGCGAASKPAGTGGSPSPSPVASPSSGTSSETVELTVSAAASLTDALKEIQQAYESANAQMKLAFNFGASGALQQQIEQGAPADLFLSAAAKNMKALVDKQLIDSNDQRDLLQGELVVVVPADGKSSVTAMEDLMKTDVKNVAIGIPESVPAGNYAKEALVNAKLWEKLQAKLVQGKDVRQVLQYVETGNADAGFVYKTDAMSSSNAKIALTVDPAVYPPILYPVGIVKATKHREAAERFYDYLQSKEALDVFAKYGFTVAKP